MPNHPVQRKLSIWPMTCKLNASISGSSDFSDHFGWLKGVVRDRVHTNHIESTIRSNMIA